MKIHQKHIKSRNDPMERLRIHRGLSGAGDFGDEGLLGSREHLVHRDVQGFLPTSPEVMSADDSMLIAALHSRIDPASPEYDAELADEIENSFDSDDDGGEEDQESILAEALEAYTDPSNPEYDPEFDREIRALRPDWFDDHRAS